MFDITKKQSIILLIIVLLCELALIIYTCDQKQVRFIDELWQISESNSPEPTYGPINKKDFNTWTEHDKWYHILNLDKNLRFTYSRIIDNLKYDSQAPLSFFILHTFSSMSSGKISKWHMLIPNIIFFFISLFFLYKIMMFFTSNHLISILSILLYATCKSGVFFVTFIRSYELFIFFVILSYYAHLRFFPYLMSTSSSGTSTIPTNIYLSLVGVFICYFLGFFNHYFFAIWAICLSICIIILSYIKRKKLFAFLYILSSSIPIILNFILNPSSLLFFTSNKNTGIVDLIKTGAFRSEIFDPILKVFPQLNEQIYIKYWLICLCIGLLISMILSTIKISYDKSNCSISFNPSSLTKEITLSVKPYHICLLVYIISSLCAFIISSKISASRFLVSITYVCFIIPLFFIFIGSCIKTRCMFVLAVLCFILSLSFLKPSELDWIKYTDEVEKFLVDENTQDKHHDIILYCPQEPNWHPLIYYTKYLTLSNRVYLAQNIQDTIPTEQASDELVVIFFEKLYRPADEVPEDILNTVSNNTGYHNRRPVSKDRYGSTWVYSH